MGGELSEVFSSSVARFMTLEIVKRLYFDNELSLLSIQERCIPFVLYGEQATRLAVISLDHHV
jgi:hypothetical protein